ncbi:triokinase/FMN cyclase isoform X1 [Tachysurus fulvidraco]|uniref:triokinase/FMN cyclase isoform X1 n=1 Tax=Tachysurus fulvidraco TaxID=1234273 RepID=UPI001FED4521|nr:triokinase/FMN cyclase isoform X1 [Tachysurus fulvidraco]
MIKLHDTNALYCRLLFSAVGCTFARFFSGHNLRRSMEVQRKLLNSVERCVDEALEGTVSSNRGLMLLRGHRVALRSDLHNLKGKVALISGGGSGHEPAHAGYIGRGMLSAAVAGAVFSSPPPGSILAAIMTLWQSGTSGVLLLVKNYTGDRLNFGLAAEKARTQGVPVDMVVVADDCAFTQPSKAGRRGLCGTVFIHKLAGALAEESCPLDVIVAKVSTAVKNIGTLGVSLSPCSVPGCLPTFQVLPGDMELGLGIHGEPGIKKFKLASADDVVRIMIDHMTDPSSQSHLPLKSDDTVVLCVNNLGALSCLEMAVVTRAAINCLMGRGVQVARVMSGSFMTSLEMAGMSLSLMRVDEEILRLFDAKTSAPAWPNLSSECLSGRNLYVEPTVRPTAGETKTEQGPFSFVACLVLKSICKALLQWKEELNALDRAAGDGDCGSTHALAATAIEEWMQTTTIPGTPYLLLTALAGLVEERMGGSSGALYSLFLTAAAPCLKESCDSKDWAKAIHAGTEAMKRYGGAVPGDRTMLDALCPAADELMKFSTASPGGHMAVLQAAVEKAELGAESTRDLTAKAGRASYIASERLTQPDPGAMAVAAIFRAMFDALKRKDQ